MLRPEFRKHWIKNVILLSSLFIISAVMITSYSTQSLLSDAWARQLSQDILDDTEYDKAAVLGNTMKETRCSSTL